MLKMVRQVAKISLLKDENSLEGGQGRAGIGVYRERETLLL